MMTVLIGAVCNIILDPVFIFGFKLGVATGSASAFSEGLATKDYVYELLEQVR